MHIRDDSWHHRSWQLEVHLPILIVLTHLQMVSWHWGTSPTIQNIPKPLVFPWFSPKNHLKTTHNLGLKSPEIPRTQSQHVPPVSWEPNSSTADPAGDWALENPPRYRPSEIGDAWSSQHFLYLKAHHNSKSHIVIYICVYNNIHYIHILYIYIYIYIYIFYICHAMTNRKSHSHCQSWSPGPVEFGGVDRVPSSSSSNLFWITATWWLESGSEWKQKRLKAQAGEQTHVDVSQEFYGKSMEIYHGTYGTVYREPNQSALSSPLCTWRRWRSCLLAAWLSLTDPNNGRHEKPEMPRRIPSLG